jgi:type IV secretion system protein VirB1
MSINVDNTPALIQRCAPNVAPQTISAVMRTESGGNPLAININYKKGRLARKPSSMFEAIGWSKWLIERGYNIDMGLMQINSRNMARFGMSVEQIFDPCTNIYVGSLILTENYVKASDKYGKGQNALFASLSAYNTGHFQRGLRNGYVHRVVKNANHPVVIKSAEPPSFSVPRSTVAQAQYAQTASASKKKHERHTKRYASYRYSPKHRSTTNAAPHQHHEIEQERAHKEAVAMAYDAPTGISMSQQR